MGGNFIPVIPAKSKLQNTGESISLLNFTPDESGLRIFINALHG
jgi:hypothetical protein